MHKRNYYAKIALQKNSKNKLNIGWCQSDCWLLNFMLLLFLLLLSCLVVVAVTSIKNQWFRCRFFVVCSFTLRTNTSDQKQSAEPLTAVSVRSIIWGGGDCRGQTTLYQLTVIILLLLFKSVRFCWTMSTTQTFALLLAARSLVVVVWSSEWVFGEWVSVCVDEEVLCFYFNYNARYFRISQTVFDTYSWRAVH